MCQTGCCCCVCVRTQSIGVIERFGKFSTLKGPGCSCVTWPCEQLVGTVSLRVQQLDVNCETKTKDNVFVNVVISVQYEAIAKAAYDAYYRLANPEVQIQAYVFDVVRSTLPRMDLDESFSSKDDLANSVKVHLDDTMSSYGYHIVRALVTDINPDARVKQSMNEINASRRLRESAKEKAEAEKITQVKAAEADAESKYLSGVGVARQRQAIVGGLQDSINEFAGEIAGTTPKDVMDLLLVTQYFDMLKEVGGKHNCTVVFIPEEE
mmetsp:Transcript_18944/g.23019  ORF Transcript_18944/g.23019 Transcript_18944/m.23019 type:complete len:266 (-) Transcript_18944:315-1112(-)